jgi:hypothetical protein
MRGVDLEKVCAVSETMIDVLEKIIECPRDYFTIEWIPSTFVCDGSIVQGYPFVEVAWFDRGQEIQDQVAREITRVIHEIGYSSVEVSFLALEKRSYYENGERFA